MGLIYSASVCVTDSQLVLYQEPEAAKWNSANICFINSTCAPPTCQTIFREKGVDLMQEHMC